MQKRQRELEEKYEAMWDSGKGSHHPDFDPEAKGEGVVKASRETEEVSTCRRAGIDLRTDQKKASHGHHQERHQARVQGEGPCAASPAPGLRPSPPARSALCRGERARGLTPSPQKIEEGADVNFCFSQ